MRRELLIVVLLVLALRVPFLNQAIQGDDVYYLYGAQHAQIDPLHPLHARYVFQGQMVDMRGHPHPPLNSWYLGLLLGIFKDVREIPLHAAYILFSLIAALSALSLAHRFSPYPLAATLLFLATPPFIINGNSLEADLPFLAFWLLSTALFVGAVQRQSLKRLIGSAFAMALAAMAAYQAVILAPILLIYAGRWGRKWRAAWIAPLTAPLMLLAWQIYERVSSGSLPAQVLTGYMQTYGLQALEPKIRSAVALTGHLAWVVFPGLWIPTLWAIPAAIGAALYDWNPIFWASIAVGIGILIWCARNWRDFLVQWTLIFFASAVAGAFAGSARYLLPIALPVAILATQRVSRRWQKIGFAVSLILGMGLAIVNYQHWDGYRQFAREIKNDVASKRVWINGEWGLRYYMESEGALPILASQAVHPGEMVVSSALCLPIQFTTGGGVLAPIAERTITSSIPLRIVALNGKSAYSTTAFGLRPFDVSLAVIDRVRADLVVERKPTLSSLPMNAPEAEQQIVSGVYQLESGQWRWMSQTAVILLKPPAQPAPLVVRFTIPEQSPARQLTVELNNQRVASQTFAVPGAYTLSSPPLQPDAANASVTISVDKTFSVPGDHRQLGIILSEVGFR